MKGKSLLLGSLSLLCLFSCGKKADTQADATAKYPTMVVKKANATLENVYPVTVRGQIDVEIRPRIDGFIDAIYVDEGSVVRKGQSLFKINSPSAEQALRSAKAAVKSAEAQLATSKVNVDRLRPLAEKGIISEVQLQTAENVYLSTLAGVEQAMAGLKNAEAMISWTQVLSPIDGVVGTISFRQGSLVNSSNSLTTVANTSNVYAYFSLNEKSIGGFLDALEGETQAQKITNAPELTLTLADGTVYSEKGKLETISGVVNVSTGSINFRAAFPNPNGVLRSGVSGRISIPHTLNDVFVIPQAATFTQQDKVLVYQVVGDSAAQKIITVIPVSNGKEYAVTEGLAENDEIVSSGVVTITNGMKVR
jgi:RND family efflux transporter, MFP subunit